MARQQKTLERIQAKPTPSDLRWEELRALLEWLGYRMLKGDGARRKFVHQETKAVLALHEPHKPATVGKKCLDSVVQFLKDKGHI
jgi:hypothetical protein